MTIMELTEYVPREELERRWVKVRRFMDCDSLVILQNVDQFYLTGTVQTAVLWFPRDGEPLLAVRKSFERAKTESPVKNIVPLKTYSDLPMTGSSAESIVNKPTSRSTTPSTRQTSSPARTRTNGTAACPIWRLYLTRSEARSIEDPSSSR